jgi:hypothetical protein
MLHLDTITFSISFLKPRSEPDDKYVRMLWVEESPNDLDTCTADAQCM